MVDELIREITEPEENSGPTAKAAARGRLLLAAKTEHPGSRKRQRLSRRGLAVLVALVAVPTGVAVATAGVAEGPGDDRAALQELPATPIAPSSTNEGAEIDFFTEGVPAASSVDECRSGNSVHPPLHCEAVIAIAEGELAPGGYSDAQLDARLNGHR